MTIEQESLNPIAVSRSARGFLEALAKPESAKTVVMFAVLVGVSLCVAGMSLYPGGTNLDPTTQGYAFWHNFLCDAVRPLAINGVPNALGHRLMQVGLTVLTAGFLPIWRALPLLLSRSSLAGSVIRRAGGAGTALMLPVVYGGHVGPTHNILYVAGPLCIIALATTLAELSLEESKSWLLLGATASLGLTSLVDLYLYAHMGSLNAMQPVVPAIQKMVLMLAIAWMLIAAAAISKASIKGSRGRVRNHPGSRG